MTGMTARDTERAEAQTLFDLEDRAPRAARDGLGLAARRLDDGWLLAAARDPSGYWSKAIGFGLDRPPTADLLRRIAAAYREVGVAEASLQLVADTLPPDWARIRDEVRDELELVPETPAVKLAAAVDDVLAAPDPGLDPRLRVVPVTQAQARDWAGTMMDGFTMPRLGAQDMIAAAAVRPGWHPFAVRYGDGICLATGAVRIDGPVGHLFGAATLPHARGRGAQSALIRARARVARDHGCRVLCVETGAETVGHPHNSSLHNLRRAGFTVVHTTASWSLRPSG